MVSVHVQGPPVIVISNTVDTSILSSIDTVNVGHQQADNVEFELDFCSNPPSDIRWNDGNENVLSAPGQSTVLSSATFSIIESHVNGNVPCYSAKMFLPNVQSSQAGIYEIQIENEFGTVRQEFHLTIKDNLFNFEVLLATTSGFLLTILLLIFVIISLCQRRSSRQSETSGISKETDFESASSRDNSSSEELITPLPSESENLRYNFSDASRDSSDDFSNIYGFPRLANGGSLRKGSMERKSCYGSGYIHINTNAYSYVSFDDVDKQISNIL